MIKLADLIITLTKNLAEILMSRKYFFPKNYSLWICLYAVVNYIKPKTNNPFDTEVYMPNYVSHNGIFMILLIAHPILISIDTMSFAQFLKKNLMPQKSYLLISLFISFLLFKNQMNQFENFGDDGLTNSLFYGVSYVLVIVASLASFIYGILVLR